VVAGSSADFCVSFLLSARSATLTAPIETQSGEADMQNRLKVLVACSDLESGRQLRECLSQCGLDPIPSSTVKEARAILSRQSIPLVICATDLADGTFRDLLRAAEIAAPQVPVVVASHGESTAEYLEAMEMGAFDFIACPCRRAELEWIVSNALRRAVVAAHA